MWQYNYLSDKDFLSQLDAHREREIYAKIVALTFQEEPIELIQGQVTQGSVNIDGASAVRRTCNLTLIAKELNINDYYWNIKTKFYLEIGLKNTINSKYPEIIWFPQGTFVITSFNTNQSANNYNVTISGKDKMCLLNGDLGGSLPASIDFGVEEYWDKTNNTTTYTNIPIKTIIREAVHTYAKEPYHNIIINDLDDAAVELLEYRGDVPLYLTHFVEWDVFDNATLDGSAPVRFEHAEDIPDNYFPIEELTNHGGYYDSRVDLNPSSSTPSRLIFQKDSQQKVYTVAKIEYGQTVGYRKTELTYAGNLISSIGEALTSILDKIVKMLGEYEYFYNLEGQFVFQKKRTYIQNTWNNIKKVDDDQYIEPSAFSSAVTYRFENNNLITSFSNTPNLANMRNDYSVWGQRESITGEKLPIHYRYAIDEKPKYYKNYNGHEFFSSEEELERKKAEEKEKALTQFIQRINDFKLEHPIPEGLTATTKKSDGSWEPGWWDIRDWYNYHYLLTKEYPNKSIKWYAQEHYSTGAITVRDIPGYQSHQYRSSKCWLLVDNGDNVYTFLGRATPSTYVQLCTQYESYIQNGELITQKVSPIQQQYFGVPFYATLDTLTYLELMKQYVDTGKPVYIYNPVFPALSNLTEAEMEQFEAEWADRVHNLEFACVDWREMIYQMALDYYQYHDEDNFLSVIARNNPEHYPSGTTGYEQYYIDLQGFWRQLYNPSPEPNYVTYENKKITNDKFQIFIPGTTQNKDLYIIGQYREIQDWTDIKESEVVALKKISDQYQLIPWEDAIEIDYYNSFVEAANGVKYSNKYYTVTRNDNEGTTQYSPIPFDIKDSLLKSELFIVESDGTMARLIESTYAKDKAANNILGFYHFVDDKMPYSVFTEVDLKDLYYKSDWYNKYIYASHFDIEGKVIENSAPKKQSIDYFEEEYDYIVDTDSEDLFWTTDLINAPAQLNFWFDFLDPSDPNEKDAGYLGQFSVKSLGDRAKVVNDTSVTAIYFRKVPDVIFVMPEDRSNSSKNWTGYTTIYMQGTVESLFSISSQGKSAQDRLDELLYNHSYCIESVTIQAVPIYHLEPNTRIFVRDDQSKINGEYIVSKISLPLAYNGTMSITATKAPERLI